MRITIPQEVRQLVRELFCNRCAKCGCAKHLHIHHVDEDATNNELYNLMLLCKWCHAEEHPLQAKRILAFSKATADAVEVIDEYDELLQIQSGERIGQEVG